MNMSFPAIPTTAAIRYGLVAAMVSVGGVMALSALNASMGERLQDLVSQGGGHIVPIVASAS